jgi:hypothetical protein
MASIFHYTSNEGAISIVNSDLLFATHYKYLNDPQELALGQEYILPILEREFREVGHELIRNGRLHDDFLKHHGEQIFSREARKLFEVCLRVIDSTTPIFITSFCRHDPDTEQHRNGLLSQWRGYGSLGGCALELDEQQLEALIAVERDKYAYSHISLKDVEYEKHEEAIDQKAIEGVASSILMHMIERSPETERVYNEHMHNMYNNIAVVMPTLKSAGFQEEREVRIIVPCMRTEAAGEYPQRERKQIYHRYRSGLPVPYIRLFDETGSLPIKRVIVGPQRDQDKVAYSVELALEGKGLNVEVTRSNISYIPL